VVGKSWSTIGCTAPRKCTIPARQYRCRGRDPQRGEFEGAVAQVTKPLGANGVAHQHDTERASVTCPPTMHLFTHPPLSRCRIALTRHAERQMEGGSDAKRLSMSVPIFKDPQRQHQATSIDRRHEQSGKLTRRMAAGTVAMRFIGRQRKALRTSGTKICRVLLCPAGGALS